MMVNSQPPKKVVHLITDLITAGAQNALLRLLQHIDPAEYKPIVIALRNGDTEIADKLKQMGVTVIDLKMLPRWRLDKLVGLYFELRRQEPDILHCWMIHSNIIGRLVGRLAKVPRIIVSRRSDRNGSQWATILNRWLVNWSDAIIAVSESTRQVELAETGTSPDRVITVPNGLDSTQFTRQISAKDRYGLRAELGYTDEHFVIGSVGRLVEAKGYPDLLSAFQKVAAEYSNARLIIVGKGKLQDELHQLADELGITEKVEFPGVRTDIPQILNCFDLFAFSSHWEGMPNALMEAMAAGLPCVATRVSAAPELIDDGVHGCLVPPKAPDLLADAMLEMIGDEPTRNRLAFNGQRKIAKEFTLEETAAKTVQIYSDLLKK
ncbi:MAG: glycosyltransferase [Chloroflexota bacterium]